MASRKKNITPIIVGIGSSAGGLEALQQLFKHIAPDSHKAFIVMQHLDPKHTSLLTEILQRCTSLPVTEISDGLQLMPNHIYVNPPNREIVVFQGKLQVSSPLDSKGPRSLIDGFFFVACRGSALQSHWHRLVWHRLRRNARIGRYFSCRRPDIGARTKYRKV